MLAYEDRPAVLKTCAPGVSTSAPSAEPAGSAVMYAHARGRRREPRVLPSVQRRSKREAA